MSLVTIASILSLAGIGCICGGAVSRGQAKKSKNQDAEFIAKLKKTGTTWISTGVVLLIIGQGIGVYDVFGNKTKKDLLAYINTELPKIAEYESVAINEFSAVTGNNYTDDQTLYDALTDTIIPAYGVLRSSLEEITLNLKTRQIRELNEIYIDAANEQYNAFLAFQTALLQGDASLIAQANEKLDKGRKLLRSWKTELDDLCAKNGVTLNQ